MMNDHRNDNTIPKAQAQKIIKKQAVDPTQRKKVQKVPVRAVENRTLDRANRAGTRDPLPSDSAIFCYLAFKLWLSAAACSSDTHACSCT